VKDKILGIGYLLGILLLTGIHSPVLYGFIFILLSILSGNSFLPLFKKVVITVMLFNSVVSITYVLINGVDIEYLVLVNARGIDITFMTFLFIKNVNLFRLMEFSRTLTYLLVISYSQILLFRRYYREFSLALSSRSIRKPDISEKYNFLKTVSAFFMNKSLQNSSEISMVMKSRGFMY